ncbi:MAG: hypothetical protein HY791_03070 [Deltaproteobacteria bacterium]|nr:hypothetical protein [Deltaproteobacteria bacterium]
MNIRKFQELPEERRNEVEGYLWDGIAHLESAIAKLGVCESTVSEPFATHIKVMESQMRTLRSLHTNLTKQVEVLGMGAMG